MSMTILAGVVGPSHWAYMAKQFATKLEQVAQQRKIDANFISASIVLDAREFFQLASQFAQDEVPKNPPASANAYMIAAKAINASSPSDPDANAKTVLEKYLAFVTNIQTPRSLDNDEVETAQHLRQFLTQLHADGRSERYESRVKSKNAA